MCFLTTPNFWSKYDNYSNFFPKTTIVIIDVMRFKFYFAIFLMR